LMGHTYDVSSISFSPDGTRIVSGSRDETVRLWDAMMSRPSQQCAVGWMVGPKRRLLFWVPPASRHSFWSPGTALVMPRALDLDLSLMAHGQHWQTCREG
ncbi:hypothetical protein BDR04DRAFT_934660, partial [Suillus decipiens]